MTKPGGVGAGKPAGTAVPTGASTSAVKAPVASASAPPPTTLQSRQQCCNGIHVLAEGLMSIMESKGVTPSRELAQIFNKSAALYALTSTHTDQPKYTESIHRYPAELQVLLSELPKALAPHLTDSQAQDKLRWLLSDVVKLVPPSSAGPAVLDPANMADFFNLTAPLAAVATGPASRSSTLPPDGPFHDLPTSFGRPAFTVGGYPVDYDPRIDIGGDIREEDNSDEANANFDDENPEVSVGAARSNLLAYAAIGQNMVPTAEQRAEMKAKMDVLFQNLECRSMLR
jgi:hypothetical protein